MHRIPSLALCITLVWTLSAVVPAQAQPGWVLSHQKISDTQGGFMGDLEDDDIFGWSAASLGDLDGDGVGDLAVGAIHDQDGCPLQPHCERGAVWILFLNINGTVKSHQKISDTQGGFTGILDVFDEFGSSAASLGDLDGDGVGDLVVGAHKDDDGGVNCGIPFTCNRGAVWVLFLNADGTVKSHQKISDTAGGFTGILDAWDFFGTSVASLGDLDGDGVGDIAVGATLDDDGGTDGGAVWVLFLNTDGTVKSHQKISDTAGGFTGILDAGDRFGSSVAGLGDLNDDGVGDLVAGAIRDDDGGTNRGAVWVLFLNTDGTVKSHQKISSSEGGFTGLLDDYDAFGFSAASLGDLDGDGVGDLAVGAVLDSDGGSAHGAVWVLFFNTDGTVKSHQKISSTEGGFTGILNEDDSFGLSVASVGDLDGDGGGDLAVGAYGDDDGGSDHGAVWVLFLDGVPGCSADEDGRVTICHLPPGNPENAHTITVGVNAVPAHLAHGDHCGPCEGEGGLLMGGTSAANDDPCSSDLNDFGDVGAADLAELLGAWGLNPDHPADLDGDGNVGAFDLALLLGAWGPCP